MCLERNLKPSLNSNLMSLLRGQDCSSTLRLFSLARTGARGKAQYKGTLNLKLTLGNKLAADFNARGQRCWPQSSKQSDIIFTRA